MFHNLRFKRIKRTLPFLFLLSLGLPKILPKAIIAANPCLVLADMNLSFSLSKVAVYG
jgi:hypothetical protein